MEQQIDLTGYGVLPRHVRQSLATAEKQPSENTQPSEKRVEEINNTPPQEPENQSQPDVIEQTQNDEDREPVASPDVPQNEPEDNDSKAWKGRLSKEQSEHKETKNRYLAEVEARQKAEREAQEMREKLTALEQKALAENAPPQPAPEPQKESHFSHTELSEIEMLVGGNVGKKLADYLRHQQNQTASTTPQIDVEKVLDERFNQERQRNEEQAKADAFGKAISEHAPKLQGLLNDSAFIEFVNTKVIDFAGNTASSFLNFVGSQKRADLVPKVAELISEFEQSRQPQAQPVTAPPSNKGGESNVRNSGKKPKPTPAIINQMNRLMRLGETDKLRELQEKYDLD